MASLTATRRLGSLPVGKSSLGRDMIKSEMVDCIAESNPPLYRRDVERIVEATLREIVDVMRQGGRAELAALARYQSSNAKPERGATHATEPMSRLVPSGYRTSSSERR